MQQQVPGDGKHAGWVEDGAGDGLRTRYLNLGKVALYQMSYSRAPGRREPQMYPIDVPWMERVMGIEPT